MEAKVYLQPGASPRGFLLGSGPRIGDDRSGGGGLEVNFFGPPGSSRVCIYFSKS